MHEQINFATIGRGMIVKHFLAAMAGIEQFHYIGPIHEASIPQGILPDAMAPINGTPI